MQSIRIEMYYTYAYLREDKTPYYIGKGKGYRINSKQRNIKPPKNKSRIIFLKQNLTEEEAFKHEIYMIDVFGRKDLGTGILHNRTDGGEGSSGAIRSDEYRKKMSEAKKGKTRSEESKIKMSEASKGRTHSEETKRKLSDANSGENNPRYGKTHSEETKKRMSDAHKNPPEEIRKKQSVAMSGRKWWNDGCGNVKLMIECPGDGWKLGMKPNGIKDEI